MLHSLRPPAYDAGRRRAFHKSLPGAAGVGGVPADAEHVGGGGGGAGVGGVTAAEHLRAALPDREPDEQLVPAHVGLLGGLPAGAAGLPAVSSAQPLKAREERMKAEG